MGVTDKPESLLEKAKDNYKFASDAWAKQRQRSKEDLAFQVAENQWDEEAKKERKGRPMLSISLLRQPQALVRNQAANAKLGLDLSPVSEDANKELAEIKQGLYRRIERDGQADQARMWALAHAVQCGLGWYGIDIQYDEDSDDPLDQEIVYRRILHQESVLMDPAAQKPDFSDAEFCFIVTRIPEDRFRREFPEAEMAAIGFDFEDVAEREPDWVQFNGERVSVVVAEYFYKKHDVETVKHKGRERKVDHVSVNRALLTAVEVLEDQPWGGSEGVGARYIPIIPVIGDELQPIEGERRFEGMVRPARDGQVAFNYAISMVVEDISRLSKAPYIGAEGQFEGHEEEWKQANRKNYPYLEYKTKDVDGKPAPPPAPMQIDGTKMGLSLQLAQEAKDLVRISTAIYEPSLGDLPKRKEAQSGRAILALQQQADAGTSNYIQNLVGISLPCDGRIVLDLMPTTYDRPGRVTQVLGGEDESKPVMLNQPFVMDPEGKPVPAQPGQPGVKTYDLSKGKYSIATSAGKSFQTRLEQGATEMGEILAGAPELMPVIGDLYFKYRNFPGAKEISERLAKWREKQIPGLGEEKDGQIPPEQAQAQLEGMKQQMQGLRAQLQQAVQMIETEKVKHDAMLQKAEMESQTKLALAKLEQEQAARQDALKITLEKMQQRFEEWQTKFEAAHEVAMAAAGGRNVTMKREGGQETGEEQGQESGQSSVPQMEGAEA